MLRAAGIWRWLANLIATARQFAAIQKMARYLPSAKDKKLNDRYHQQQNPLPKTKKIQVSKTGKKLK